MRVLVDYTLCEGNLDCLDICPEIFAVNEANQAVLLLDEIPQYLEERARTAVKTCPRVALSIDE